MTNSELLAFLRAQKWAVACTAGAGGAPESALVGVGFSDNLEIIFDTSRHSRKVVNLQQNSGISFVIGGWVDGDEQTVQFEELADLPLGEELKSLKQVYFSAFPDGRKREAEPETIYVRATPRWVRYSNFNQSPPIVQEFKFVAGATSSGDESNSLILTLPTGQALTLARPMKDDPAAGVESLKRRMFAMFGFCRVGARLCPCLPFGRAAYESAFMVGFWVALAGAAGSALWLMALIPR